MSQAILFLLDALVGFFSVLFLARFFLQLCRASFSNQLSQFVVQLTNWAVKPLRRVIPGFFGLDFASLLPAYLLQVLLLLVVVALQGLPPLALGGGFLLVLLGQAALALLRLCVYLLIGALIMQAVLSWVSPYSPLAQPIDHLTRPVLAPIRRFLPPISGIDLSPMVAILLAQALLIFL
jgi:YggT family protein